MLVENPQSRLKIDYIISFLRATLNYKNKMLHLLKKSEDKE